MTWDEAASFLRGADWHGTKAGLERINELMDLLGNPQKHLRFVHIAGTNGKGSAAAMISNILTASGYKTGLYTSPHLIQVNERFQIDSITIDDEDIKGFAARVRKAAEQMSDKPADFELMTALAFLYFSEEHCDIAVLEVGMGGRFDATNVIDSSLVSVIMKIGLDHTMQLGNTIEEIAGEKAGIIKDGSDVVLYAQSDEVYGIINELCKKKNARLTVTKPGLIYCEKVSDRLVSVTDPVEKTGSVTHDTNRQRFSYKKRDSLYLNLDGPHQLLNAAAALDTIDILRDRHELDRITESAIRTGLSSVFWPGRFETINRSPLVIVDGAHNPDGIKALTDSILSELPGKKLILIMGIMKDKNHAQMLKDLADTLGDRRDDILLFIATAPDEDRALHSVVLESEIKTFFSCKTITCDTSDKALERAFEEADDATCILAFGSLYLVGELKNHFLVAPPWKSL